MFCYALRTSQIRPPMCCDRCTPRSGLGYSQLMNIHWKTRIAIIKRVSLNLATLLHINNDLKQSLKRLNSILYLILWSNVIAGVIVCSVLKLFVCLTATKWSHFIPAATDEALESTSNKVFHFKQSSVTTDINSVQLTEIKTAFLQSFEYRLLHHRVYNAFIRDWNWLRFDCFICSHKSGKLFVRFNA